MRPKNDIRIFFALWPDGPTREQLQQRALQMPLARPARRVPDYNLHLTLHFIGNISVDRLGCLQRQARKVSAESFELLIDGSGFFRRARVGWLGCSAPPAELAGLHHDLGQKLLPCGFRPEARAYNPHVTVARKINRQPELPVFEPLRWKVDNFVLIESRADDSGVRYEVVETYPLTWVLTTNSSCRRRCCGN